MLSHHYYGERGEIVCRCKGTDLFKIRMESGDIIEFFKHEFEKLEQGG